MKAGTAAELVVDASILSALILYEEGSENIREVVESDSVLYAPSFWRFEVSNVVWKRRTMPPKVAEELIRIIWSFPIHIRESKDIAVESISLAFMCGITFYDSYYIAVAKSMGLPLWTMDQVQAGAAVKAGVYLWKK